MEFNRELVNALLVMSMAALYNGLKDLVLLLKPSFLETRKNIQGQVAVVTGGGNGLGRQLCLGLAKLGATVVIWDVDNKATQVTKSLIQELGHRAYAYMCDVSDREEVYRVGEVVKREVGKVDILVNNAGVASGKFFHDLKDWEIERTYGINILSHYWTCKTFLPDMIKDNKGHVLATASAAGFIPGPKMCDYSGTKHAVLGFMESLQMEMIRVGATGVKMTTTCPIFMKTEIFKTEFSDKIPILDVEESAIKMLDGMLTNKEVVVIPRIVSVLRILKAMFVSSRTIMAVIMARPLRIVMDSIQAKGLVDVLAYDNGVGNKLT